MHQAWLFDQRSLEPIHYGESLNLRELGVVPPDSCIYKYIILENGRLLISQKTSHRDLANGQPVLAAGEILYQNWNCFVNTYAPDYNPVGSHLKSFILPKLSPYLNSRLVVIFYDEPDGSTLSKSIREYVTLKEQKQEVPIQLQPIEEKPQKSNEVQMALHRFQEATTEVVDAYRDLAESQKEAEAAQERVRKIDEDLLAARKKATVAEETRKTVTKALQAADKKVTAAVAEKARAEAYRQKLQQAQERVRTTNESSLTAQKEAEAAQERVRKIDEDLLAARKKATVAEETRQTAIKTRQKAEQRAIQAKAELKAYTEAQHHISILPLSSAEITLTEFQKALLSDGVAGSAHLDVFIPYDSSSFTWDEIAHYSVNYGYRGPTTCRSGYGEGSHHHHRIHFLSERIELWRNRNNVSDGTSNKLAIFSQMLQRLKLEESLALTIEQDFKKIACLQALLTKDFSTLKYSNETDRPIIHAYIEAFFLNKKNEISLKLMEAIQLLNRTHYTCVKTMTIYDVASNKKPLYQEAVRLKELQIKALFSARSACSLCLTHLVVFNKFKETITNPTTDVLNAHFSSIQKYECRTDERMIEASEVEKRYLAIIPPEFSTDIILENADTYAGPAAYIQQKEGLTTTSCLGAFFGSITGALFLTIITGGAAAAYVLPAAAITATGSFIAAATIAENDKHGGASAKFESGFWAGFSLMSFLGNITKDMQRSVPPSTPSLSAEEKEKWAEISRARREKAEEKEHKEVEMRGKLENIRSSVERHISDSTYASRVPDVKPDPFLQSPIASLLASSNPSQEAQLHLITKHVNDVWLGAAPVPALAPPPSPFPAAPVGVLRESPSSDAHITRRLIENRQRATRAPQILSSSTSLTPKFVSYDTEVARVPDVALDPLTRCYKDSKCALFSVKRFSADKILITNKDGSPVKKDLLDELKQSIKGLESFLICETDHQGTTYRPVELPVEMMQNILAFLKEDRPRNTWKCQYFVRAAHGFEYVVDNTAHKYFYVPYQDAQSNFVPGDTLAFQNKHGQLKHFAIYLSDNLCLSKLGINALQITTIQEMHSKYGTTGILPLRPITPEIKEIMKRSGYSPQKDHCRSYPMFEEPAPSSFIEAPTSHKKAYGEEPIREGLVDRASDSLSKRLPPPLNEVAGVVKNDVLSTHKDPAPFLQQLSQKSSKIPESLALLQSPIGPLFASSNPSKEAQLHLITKHVNNAWLGAAPAPAPVPALAPPNPFPAPVRVLRERPSSDAHITRRLIEERRELTKRDPQILPSSPPLAPELARCYADPSCNLLKVAHPSRTQRLNESVTKIVIKDKDGRVAHEDLLKELKKSMHLGMKSFLICQEDQSGSHLTPITLPHDMVRHIVSFLEKDYPQFRWYCHHFVAAACGIPFNPNSREHINSWFYTAYRCDGLVPGDVVALFDGVRSYEHYAVSLGNNLFLSKFNDGILTITTVEEMHRRYATKSLVLLRPMTTEIRQLMRNQGWDMRRDGVFREPAPSSCTETPTSHKKAYDEDLIGEGLVDIAYDSLSKRLPPPLKEVAGVVKKVSKAGKLIKKQGFFSAYVTAAGVVAGRSIGAYYGGPVGGIVGAAVGEYIARPIGDMLEQAKMGEARRIVDTIEGGGIPFDFFSYH